ncbi:MAG TPA: hypothetical protein DCR87_05860 [Acidobacteria bacterium]|nr:hypothetical protein [Acidobacteriota bacterium]
MCFEKNENRASWNLIIILPFSRPDCSGFKKLPILNSWKESTDAVKFPLTVDCNPARNIKFVFGQTRITVAIPFSSGSGRLKGEKKK